MLKKGTISFSTGHAGALVWLHLQRFFWTEKKYRFAAKDKSIRVHPMIDNRLSYTIIDGRNQVELSLSVGRDEFPSARQQIGT